MAPSLSLPIPAEAHDMAVAGIVVLLALVAFISVLWLNRDGTQGGKNRGGVNAAQGTVFVTEDGKTVRRSARARKPAAEDALLATPAPKAEPKVKSTTERSALSARLCACLLSSFDRICTWIRDPTAGQGRARERARAVSGNNGLRCAQRPVQRPRGAPDRRCRVRTPRPARLPDTLARPLHLQSPKATRAAPPKTPPKTPTAAKTPVAAAERMTSPGRTRRAAAAAPKATPIAATPDTAVRDATSPTRRRRRAI